MWLHAPETHPTEKLPFHQGIDGASPLGDQREL
jgi:hypothetical protein